MSLNPANWQAKTLNGPTVKVRLKVVADQRTALEAVTCECTLVDIEPLTRYWITFEWILRFDIEVCSFKSMSRRERELQ